MSKKNNQTRGPRPRVITELPTPQKIRAVERMSRERIEATKNLKTWLFIIVTAIALVYTGLTSYSLIYKMTAHRGIYAANIAAIAGIALTDGMFLYWTLVGFRKADSSPQRITAGFLAAITVTAIAVFGVGEQMLIDKFVTALQMRYVVTAFVIAQIIGVAIYELASYEAKISMKTYANNMRTVQILDAAQNQQTESFADVILAEAEKRANFAYQIAAQVRSQTDEIEPEVEIAAPPPEEPTIVQIPQTNLGANGNGANQTTNPPKVTRAI